MNNRHIGRAILALVAVLALSSCAASPKTSYVTDDGKSVTVDWVNYPGQAGVEAADVLLAPSAEAVRQKSQLILNTIEEQINSEFGLVWEDGPLGEGQRADGDFYPSSGNGYGGESLYVTYHSVSRETLRIPTSQDDWQRIQAIINDVARMHGLGELTSDGLVDHWQWAGMAYGQSQWLYVSLLDVERDGTGQALNEMKGGIEYGWNPRAVTISYGATVLPAGDRAAFRARLAPFEGLAQPPETSSD